MKKTILLSTICFITLIAIFLIASCTKNNTNNLVGSNNCNDNYVALSDSACCFFAPNIFSPNNDGKNDIYTLTSLNLATLTLTVKDSNQNLLYTGTGLNSGWDGKVNNILQPETHYEARFQATFSNCNLVVDTTMCFYLGQYNNGCIPKYSSTVPLKFGDQVDVVSCVNTPFISADTLCP